jgi:predicted phage-related endonuclease
MGVNVRRRRQHFIHPDYPWAQANIDRSVDGQRKVLECKNSSEWMLGSWGESGTDEVPESHLVQVAWYMAVLRYDVADLAALIGGNKLRIYSFERDLELEEMILHQASIFWNEHVQAMVPPPPQCERDLSTLYAIDNGRSLLASPETEQKVRNLSDLKSKLKDMESQIDSLKFDIRAEMGNHAELLLGADGSPLCTWRKAKDSKRLDGGKLKKERPEIWQQYAQEVQRSRRFLVKV